MYQRLLTIVLLLATLFYTGCGSQASYSEANQSVTTLQSAEPSVTLGTNVPITLTCTAESYADATTRNADSLYSLISSNSLPIKLSRMYIEYNKNLPDAFTTFMTALNKKDAATTYALLADSYSCIHGGAYCIDLSQIEAYFSTASFPLSQQEIKTFLQHYAGSVFDDFNHAIALNNASKDAKIDAILFDIETVGSDVPGNTGLFYLLYYIRQYMDTQADLKNLSLETTLKWNQVQNLSAAQIGTIFGKTLQPKLIISQLLEKYNVTANIFAMLYRTSANLIDSSHTTQTTWWKAYVQPALGGLQGSMTLTPAIGINSGDPTPLLTKTQLKTFLTDASQSLSNIEASQGISGSVLGIHGLQGFWTILNQ